jgi:hypothetical protein
MDTRLQIYVPNLFELVSSQSCGARWNSYCAYEYQRIQGLPVDFLCKMIMQLKYIIFFQKNLVYLYNFLRAQKLPNTTNNPKKKPPQESNATFSVQTNSSDGICTGVRRCTLCSSQLSHVSVAFYFFIFPSDSTRCNKSSVISISSFNNCGAISK